MEATLFKNCHFALVEVSAQVLQYLTALVLHYFTKYVLLRLSQGSPKYILLRLSQGSPHAPALLTTVSQMQHKTGSVSSSIVSCRAKISNI